MSYILEALKKAERERQKEAVPDLQTSHAPYQSVSHKHHSQRRLVKRITIIFILLVAASTLLILRDKPLSTHTAQKEHESPVQSPVSQNYDDNGDRATEQKNGTDVASHNIQAEQKRLPAKITLEPEPIVLPGKTLTPTSYGLNMQDKYPSLEELGTTVRADMPELIFAGHTFSENPEDRMIIINNRIVREGQNLGNGLRLEEITWDGLIMNFNGTRFTMKATH